MSKTNQTPHNRKIYRDEMRALINGHVRYITYEFEVDLFHRIKQ